MLKKIIAITVSLTIMILAATQQEVVSAEQYNIQALNNSGMHLNTMKDSNSWIVSISVGNWHGGIVTEDGNLYMWGKNTHGQLGDGTTKNRRCSTPIKVFENVESVSLGGYHSGAITKDGSLYMWGSNWCGLLGDGTTENKNTPVKILDNIESISLGGNHSGAITKDGSLYMWGGNWCGLLGDGTTENKSTPVKILDNIESISLGWEHSGAITKDGSLYMWGQNEHGQLGDGTTKSKSTPVKILDNIESISLGGYHSGAITKDGSLYMWGQNEHGQLGDGTTEDKSTPVKILDNIESISLGGNYSGAITKDGSLYMWGENWNGQLGDGTREDKHEYIKVLDNVESVSLGNCNSEAVTKDDSLYIWGENAYEEHGGIVKNYLYPVKIDLFNTSDDVQSKLPEDIPSKNPDNTQSETVSKKVSQKITYKSSAIKKGKKGKEVIYGSSFNLNAKTSGTGKLTYKSGNKKIFSVNSKGKVKVNGYGPTYIKIKASGGNGYKAAILGIKLTAVPRQGKITRAEWQKTGVYFNWKPEKTVDGYEYAIAYNKKFVGQGRKKTTKTGVVLTKYKTNSKKMYIRVRTYKKVDKKTYYGSWSESKLLKLKKSKRAK